MSISAPRQDLVDAVILAGGLGTRLRSVISDVPKPLAPVAGRPFLDYQLELLARSGRVRRVILATSYMADRISDHYTAHPPPIEVEFVVETKPLGTGGGLLNALHAAKTETVVVLNGDSLFRWSLGPLEAALGRLDASGAAMALVNVSDVTRYGSVEVRDGRVVAFREKGSNAGAGAINAGVYLFDRSFLLGLNLGQSFSLERDLFPKLAEAGHLAAALFDPPFIDIGLPETYALASSVVPHLTH